MPKSYTSVVVGTVLPFSGNYANLPSGYLMCDGSSLNRTGAFARLFEVIGTNFGALDTSTFCLPDLRGRFIRGTDNMGSNGPASRDPDTASRTSMNTGGSSGNSVGSVQSDQFRSHAHSSVQAGSYTAGPYSGALLQTQQNFPITGAAGGNETRPINAYLNFIIKY